MRIDSRIKNIIFDSFPHPIALQEYDRCKRNFVSYFQSHSTISAIYQIGDVNNPGISDLDLILVFRENGKFSNEDHSFLRHLDKEIFVHAPFVISEHLFPYIQYLFYTDNLRRVAGENFDFLRPTSKIEHEQLLWQLCTEAAIARLSDLIYQITLGSYLNARKMLLKINSVKHNINLYLKLVEAGGRSPERFDEGEKFKKDITELRKSWFLCSRNEQRRRIIFALSSGIEILSSIISKMVLCSQEIFNLLFKNHQPAYYLLPDIFQIFRFEFNLKTNIEIIFNPLTLVVKVGKTGNSKIARHLNDISVLTLPYELVCLFLPVIQGAPLRPLLAEDCLIIRSDRKKFWKQNESLASLFQQRLLLINEYNDFMRKMFLSSMSYLLMAPWLLENVGKFHFIKKSALRAVLKLSLV